MNSLAKSANELRLFKGPAHDPNYDGDSCVDNSIYSDGRAPDLTTTGETPQCSPNLSKAIPAFQLEDVSWGPSSKISLVKGVNLSIYNGRFTAIVGANGAGKSSLLRLLYRFHRPNAGRVLLNGCDIWHLSSWEVASSVAAVLQEQPADFGLQVHEVVSLGAQLQQKTVLSPTKKHIAPIGDIVAKVMAQLELEPLATRSFSSLSGGEKQRVMVARALVQQPSILILDEPTNHLDIRHQLEILELLKTLDLTIVCSLHDLNLARSYADDVVVVNEGRVVAQGGCFEALTPKLISQVFNVRTHLEKLEKSQQEIFQFQI